MRIKAPVCRNCRRENTKLFLKGDRCQGAKCALEKDRPPVYRRRSRFGGRDSIYRTQLREKEKVRAYYGVMERQFARYFEMARKSGKAPGEKLLVFLERRLDNTILQAGFIRSRRTVRQTIYGGNVRVNGRRVDASSYLVKPGDEIAFRPGSSVIARVKKDLEESRREEKPVPGWISADRQNLTISVLREPSRGEVTLPVEEGHIVDLYSR